MMGRGGCHFKWGVADLLKSTSMGVDGQLYGTKTREDLGLSFTIFMMGRLGLEASLPGEANFHSPAADAVKTTINKEVGYPPTCL